MVVMVEKEVFMAVAGSGRFVGEGSERFKQYCFKYCETLCLFFKGSSSFFGGKLSWEGACVVVSVGAGGRVYRGLGRSLKVTLARLHLSCVKFVRLPVVDLTRLSFDGSCKKFIGGIVGVLVRVFVLLEQSCEKMMGLAVVFVGVLVVGCGQVVINSEALMSLVELFRVGSEVLRKVG
jgi:hypothetical protein